MRCHETIQGLERLVREGAGPELDLGPEEKVERHEVRVQVYFLGSLGARVGMDGCDLECRAGTPLVWFLGTLAKRHSRLSCLVSEHDSYVPYLDGREVSWWDTLCEDATLIFMPAAVVLRGGMWSPKPVFAVCG